MEIQVKNSGVVPRQWIDQGERGTILVAEEGKVPFDIQRVYIMSGIEGKGTVRGNHAHKKTDQAIFVVKGSMILHLDDGEQTQSIKMSSEVDGVRLGPLLWHSMSDFTPDCVALVVSNAPYDASDYIHDYNEFKTSRNL
jgi:hypothetical protein